MVGKVLFVMEKYCDADPKYGPTNSESQLVGAVESSELVGEIKRFYYDTLCQQFGYRKMVELLLEDYQVFQPDLVIYSPMEGLLGIQLDPPGEITKAIPCVTYTHLWDTVGREDWVKQHWVPFTDYTGIADAVASNSKYGDDRRVIQAYSAINSRDFYNKHLERDIDVSFIGAVDYEGVRWPQRIRHINFLRANGINVFVAGGQRQKRISWEEYSNLLNRSKISLNWAANPGTGTSQIKGRAFESMACGAMLSEDNGTETKRFFASGKDFIIFDSPDDLLEKVCYYVKHDDERKAIALSGWERVTKLYNARNMWGYIFKKMGFEPPRKLTENPNYIQHQQKIDSLRNGL